jgi:serine/threonine protein kinase
MILFTDIKPANLLINMMGDIKVSDLGILRQIEPELDLQGEFELDENGDKTAAIHRAHTFVGTTTYMAPERIDGQEYSYSSDIWSFGLALLTVALGRLPLETTGGFWQVLQSVRDKPAPVVPDDGNWSRDFRDFIAQCLIKTPDDRPSASALLKHPFLSRAFAEESEDVENVGVEELKSIVKALYAHVELLRNDSMKTSFGGERVEMELNRQDSQGTPPTLDSGKENQENGDLISSMDMTKLLMFGEQPHSGRDADSKTHEAKASSPRKTHRLKTLADQLHIPLPMAIQIARKTLASLQESDGPPSRNHVTPKATHGVKHI